MSKLVQLKNKRIAVLGAGEEGLATASFLRKNQIDVTLFDEKLPSRIPKIAKEFIKQTKIKAILGQASFKSLVNFDVVFRSPGIPLRTIKKILGKKVEITSQTKLFFDFCPCPIIGVTGTKGKGTTATLITRMLKTAISAGAYEKNKLISQNTKVYLTGNIGEFPPLSFVNRLKSRDVVVFELSSFQLEDLHISPHVSVVLMVVPDHLEYNTNHRNMNEYVESKANIVLHQTKKDFVIYEPKNSISTSLAKKSPGTKIAIGPLPGENKLVLSSSVLIENFRAASLTAKVAGVKPEVCFDVVKKFKSLPNRLELVAVRKGIKFYNDSLSTIPDSTVRAVKQFTQPIILLLGGVSKVPSYEVLVRGLAEAQNVKAVLLYGQNRGEIKKAFQKNHKITFPVLEVNKDFKKIFSRIKNIATKGDAVLLSPASASFDMFQNYKERGAKFTEYAQRF